VVHGGTYSDTDPLVADHGCPGYGTSLTRGLGAFTGGLAVGRGSEYPGEEDPEDRAASAASLYTGHERRVERRPTRRTVERRRPARSRLQRTRRCLVANTPAGV